MSSIRTLIFILIASIGSAANFVPNSSFESGYSRGWCAYATGPNQAWGNLEFGNGLLTNDALHGQYSLRVPTGARLVSRAIWLTNGNYRISFYGKGVGSLPYGLFDEVALQTAANPFSTAVLTGSWVRYSAAFVCTSNQFYWVRFGFLNSPAQVDAIQLEPGVVVTAYSPQSTVEVGLSVANTNNMWFSTDTPAFNMNFWNEGGPQNIQVRYDIYNSWNSNVFGANASPLISGGTNTTISLPMPSQKGWLKVVSKLIGVSGSDDEMDMVVYPYPSNITASATSWLGGHPHISPFHARREHLARRNTARGLSPNGIAARWQAIQPSTNTDFVFFDVCYTNWQNEGLGNIVCLTPEDGVWNPWATNANGTASEGFWSNYCYMVANRVCNGLGLTNVYFDIGPNEPYQHGPTTPTDFQQLTNYARFANYAIQAVTNAYNGARILFGAGSYGNGDWVYGAWTNLSAGAQASTVAIATHQYPNDLSIDPNIGEFEYTRFTQPGPWLRTFGSIKPVWNTESGTYDTGPILGLNGFWGIAYFLAWTPTYESERSESMLRQLTSTVRILPQALRCIGYGMRKFVYYDCRYFNDSSFTQGNPYVADYMQVDRPCAVALSVASSLVDYGFGAVTNSVTYPYLEMYCYTNSSGNPVVAAWSADRMNRTLTLTNSNYELLDMMGNQIQPVGSLTAKVCRVPEYFRSTTLTLAQLSNTLARAVAVMVADVLAPKISIDVVPIGLYSGDTNRVLFKWSAIDDTYTAWQSAASNTNVVSKWKLDGGSYSIFSPSNHVLYPNLAAGNHTFYVTSMDAVGNAAETVYSFSTSTPGGGGTFNVTGTLRVTGTLTIGP